MKNYLSNTVLFVVGDGGDILFALSWRWSPTGPGRGAWRPTWAIAVNAPQPTARKSIELFVETGGVCVGLYLALQEVATDPAEQKYATHISV